MKRDSIMTGPLFFRRRSRQRNRLTKNSSLDPLSGCRKSGLSLLEVLLALSILGISFFAIGELMRVGARSAEAARDETIAQILGESIMSQVSAGLLPPETMSTSPVDDPTYQLEWTYSINIEQVDQDGLIAVWVTIQQDPNQFARPVSFSLVRWMIDPMTAQITTGSEI